MFSSVQDGLLSPFRLFTYLLVGADLDQTAMIYSAPPGHHDRKTFSLSTKTGVENHGAMSGTIAHMAPKTIARW